MVFFKKSSKYKICLLLWMLVGECAYTKVLHSKIEYFILDSNVEHRIENSSFYVFSMNSQSYNHPIFITNSQFFNFNASKVKIIKSITILDSSFYFAKMPGVVLENCTLRNVKFVNSDLSFVRFKNCTVENVIYEDSVTYGLK